MEREIFFWSAVADVVAALAHASRAVRHLLHHRAGGRLWPAGVARHFGAATADSGRPRVRPPAGGAVTRVYHPPLGPPSPPPGAPPPPLPPLPPSALPSAPLP